jgi:hypothetical protein
MPKPVPGEPPDDLNVIEDWWDPDRLYDEVLPEWAAKALTPNQRALSPTYQWRLLLRHSKLPGVARSVALWVSQWPLAGPDREGMKDKHKARMCYPSVSQIADASGFTERTVRRALQDLESAGWVKIVRHQWRHMHNDYWIDVPEDEPQERIRRTSERRPHLTESPRRGDRESPHPGQRVTPPLTQSPRQTRGNTRVDSSVHINSAAFAKSGRDGEDEDKATA